MICDPILVTGCARSGTSMVAGILDICGCFGGDTYGGNDNNPKGFYENKVIRQDIVKPYLRSLGVDPMGQNPLPNPSQILSVTKDRANRLRNDIILAIKAQGYKDGLWYYKGAKICLVWMIWHMAFPQANWLVVRRRSEDIVSSCMRTSFMRAFNYPKGWERWVKIHLTRFEEMENTGLNITEVWPSEFMQGDFDSIQKFVEKVGGTWREQAVRNFVIPEYWKEASNG